MIGLLFSAESTSTLADRKLVQETLTYQSDNEHGQPVYTDSLGKRLEVVVMDRDSFTLPNGFKGTWLPQHGEPPKATEYPADVPVEAGVYPLPEDKSLPIHFSREADQRQGLILEHPGTGERVLIYYSSGTDDGKVTVEQLSKNPMKPLDQVKFDRDNFDWSWTLPSEVVDRIPKEWAGGIPTKKGTGWRWHNPENANDGIRIDKGNPDADDQHKTQRVDHVIVNKSGKIIGRSGNPIDGAIQENAVDAHIPLSEYVNWKNWYTP
ncbi:MAG: hypothetical protein ACR2PX_20985 [Endozoicomonas sp.]